MIRSRTPRTNNLISIQKITIINSNNVSLNPINHQQSQKHNNKSADNIKNKYRNKSIKKKITCVATVEKGFDLNEQITKAKQR